MELARINLALAILLFSKAVILHAGGDSGPVDWAGDLDPPPKEKLTYLHFYFHDVPSGHHETAFKIAEATITNKSDTLFGLLVAADDPLTVGPEPTSRMIGRAQGIYALASREETTLLLAMYYYFTEGKYNGSSISIFGRNAVAHKHREMPVVGGTGVFRLARGYALSTHYSSDVENGDIIEFNVTVFHY
uniref:Dirigent protein n=1 Tax=Kadsura heteroclita TaxID=124781 RepID=A0A7U3VI96_9MAGN|nr:dirigent protein 6 [Kadsura heteroclita]